jgi:hypothetical protein
MSSITDTIVVAGASRLIIPVLVLYAIKCAKDILLAHWKKGRYIKVAVKSTDLVQYTPTQGLVQNNANKGPASPEENPRDTDTPSISTTAQTNGNTTPKLIHDYNPLEK